METDLEFSVARDLWLVRFGYEWVPRATVYNEVWYHVLYPLVVANAMRVHSVGAGPDVVYKLKQD